MKAATLARVISQTLSLQLSAEDLAIVIYAQHPVEQRQDEIESRVEGMEELTRTVARCLYRTM